MEKTRTYSELTAIPDFEGRLAYLRLQGQVGDETFGWDRYFNQKFYKDPFWKAVRRDIIIRDGGFDLGVPDYPIIGKIIVHHMNPITVKDIEERSDILFMPEYLICVSHDTHMAIHYGRDAVMPVMAERKPHDTCPWKKGD